MSLKNINKAEERYIVKIKELACGVCNAPGPSDAHHVLDYGLRVSHFLIIPLCKSCHQDPEFGVHGRKTAWKIHKKSLLDILAETNRKLNQ